MQLRAEVSDLATKSQEEARSYSEALLVREMEVNQLQAKVDEAQRNVCTACICCCSCICVWLSLQIYLYKCLSNTSAHRQNSRYLLKCTTLRHANPPSRTTHCRSKICVRTTVSTSRSCTWRSVTLTVWRKNTAPSMMSVRHYARHGRRSGCEVKTVGL